MPGSDISVTTATGSGTVPIATLRDVNQNVSPIHVVAVSANGVTTQVSATAPMPVSLAAPVAVTQSGTWTIPSQTSGQYSSTLPILASGQAGPLQTDANGRLLISGNISSSAGASELHLGEVGGNVAKFQAPFGPAASTQFSAGVCMSAPIEITGAGRVAGGTGMVMGATVLLNIANIQPVDLILFVSQPTGTYIANTVFTPAPADMAKIAMSYHVTDWTPLGAAAALGEALPAAKFYGCLDATKTTSLWAIPIARGNISLAAATDALLTLRFSRN